VKMDMSDLLLGDCYDEFNTFKRILPIILPSKSSIISTLHNQREAKKFVTLNTPRGFEVWRLVFSQSLFPAEKESCHLEHTYWRPFYQSYINFVNKNQVNYKECKRIIRKIDDVPKFEIFVLFSRLS